MTGVVCALIAALALVAGIVIGRRWRRGAVEVAPVAEPPAPGPTIGDLLERVFYSTGEGLVVVDRSGQAVLSNARARELGVVEDDKPDARAAAACAEVREQGLPVAVDLSPLDQRGRRPAAVLAHVRPLGDGYAMVEAADTSDAVRLEATRRDFVANVSHELKTPGRRRRAPRRGRARRRRRPRRRCAGSEPRSWRGQPAGQHGRPS